MLHFASTILQAFLKLENLECLYLQHNNLTSIPTNLPRSLKDLRLNHNKIEQVAFFFFFLHPSEFVPSSLKIVTNTFAR